MHYFIYVLKGKSLLKGEREVSSLYSAGKTVFPPPKKVDSYTLMQKSIQYIKDLNIRPQTIKPLKRRGGNLHDIACGNDFLDMMPKAQATKAKIDKCNYIKLKNFHSSERQSRGSMITGIVTVLYGDRW